MFNLLSWKTELIFQKFPIQKNFFVLVIQIGFLCYVVLIKKVAPGHLCSSMKKDDDDDVAYIDEDEDEADEEDYVLEDCDDL